MKDKLDILMRHYKYGEGIKKIARVTSFSRNTVRDYIREFEEKRKVLLEQDPNLDTLCIIDNLVEKRKYDSSNRTKDVMKDEFIEKIKEYLSENEYKKENGLRKQCMKAQDIHEALLDDGYKGSYPTTCIYVRKFKNNTKEAFIKQIYEFGDVCEFDWGDVKLNHDGKIKTYKMAVFTSAKNNFRIAFLYKREDTQAFIDAHARFFEITKGVFKTMVYDNMKVAVAKFVGPYEKEPTEALKKLSLFYGFNFRFCNIYSGNEKGHVEKSVDFIRRKAFSRSIDFTFEEASQYLEKILLKINRDLLKEESPYLLPYPGKYETADIRECFVDKYSTITFLNNKYSVPDHLVGKYVCLKAYVEEVQVLDGNQNIARHTRLYGFNEWNINISHYIRTLSRKPGALKGSLALSQITNELKDIYTSFFIDTPKEFIKIIELVGSIGKENVLNKINELEINSIPVTLDNIKAIVMRKDDGIYNDQSSINRLNNYDVLYATTIGGEAI